MVVWRHATIRMSKDDDMESKRILLVVVEVEIVAERLTTSKLVPFIRVEWSIGGRYSSYVRGLPTLSVPLCELDRIVSGGDLDVDAVLRFIISRRPIKGGAAFLGSVPSRQVILQYVDRHGVIDLTHVG